MSYFDDVKVRVELTAVYLTRQPGAVCEFPIAVAEKLVESEMAKKVPQDTPLTPVVRKEWQQDRPGDERIAELEAKAEQVDEQAEEIARLKAELEKAKQPKRGRPPKVESADQPSINVEVKQAA